MRASHPSLHVAARLLQQRSSSLARVRCNCCEQEYRPSIWLRLAWRRVEYAIEARHQQQQQQRQQCNSLSHRHHINARSASLCSIQNRGAQHSYGTQD
eukprot:17344-Heterococcus_DN1.PRE.2